MLQTILEPFSKIVSLLVQTRPIDYRRLVELCHLCNRVFSRVSLSSSQRSGDGIEITKTYEEMCRACISAMPYFKVWCHICGELPTMLSRDTAMIGLCICCHPMTDISLDNVSAAFTYGTPP